MAKRALGVSGAGGAVVVGSAVKAEAVMRHNHGAAVNRTSAATSYFWPTVNALR